MANNSRPYSKIAVPQPHPGVRKNLSERAISADNPDNVDPDVSPAGQEAELVLHASLKAGSVAQIVVAIIAVTGFLYLLKFVMVTMLTALLLSFILEPFVCSLNRVGVSS